MIRMTISISHSTHIRSRSSSHYPWNWAGAGAWSSTQATSESLRRYTGQLFMSIRIHWLFSYGDNYRPALRRPHHALLSKAIPLLVKEGVRPALGDASTRKNT